MVSRVSSTMGTAKYDLEKFNGKNNIGLWQLKMRTLLVQQGLEDALSEISKLSNTLADKDKKNIIDKAHRAIILGLDDKVLRKVSKETTTVGIWVKLESFT